MWKTWLVSYFALKSRYFATFSEISVFCVWNLEKHHQIKIGNYFNSTVM